MGAIANEGGLNRSDFGHITIKVDHSLVELPANLSKETWKKLEDTRISGVLIELQLDRGGSSAGRPSGGRPASGKHSGGKPAGGKPYRPKK